MSTLSRILDDARRAHGTALMGVLNLTPDSFYDGGLHEEPARARAAIDRLIEEGSDMIDLGAESSRPGAAPVGADEQIGRLEPALTYAVERGAVVSVDTTSPEVALFAVECGARIINDVSCLADEGLADVAARACAVLVLTHSRGPMSEMPGFSEWPDDAYGDVVSDVIREWSARRDRACARGVSREDVWFDPGLGFSKNAQHSLELLRRARELQYAEAPVVLGPGRKSFIAAIDPSTPDERLGGTVAACLAAAGRGVDVLRVHDVRDVRQALAVTRALSRPARREAVASA